MRQVSPGCPFQDTAGQIRTLKRSLGTRNRTVLIPFAACRPNRKLSRTDFWPTNILKRGPGSKHGESLGAHGRNVCFERRRQSAPNVSSPLRPPRRASLIFPLSPAESKRQTAGNNICKLSSEDDPVQILVPKLASRIVARAEFNEFRHLLVNALEFRCRRCE
jgi:hypothetical protein